MPLLTFVACHPDDETISSGALLIRAKKLNYDIHLIWVTGGEGSVSPEAARREAEAANVASALGAGFTFLGLRDSELALPETIKAVEGAIRKIRPNIIVWPHGEKPEQHQDHRILHEALLNIQKRYRYGDCCWLVAQPPVYSDATFDPGIYLGFNHSILTEKQQLMNLYESERRKRFASLDFLRTKAEIWSIEGNVDSPLAEPYVLHKGISPEELFRYKIVFYQDPRGSHPVKVYLYSLTEDVKMGEAHYWLNRLESEGETLPPSYAEEREDGIWLGKAGSSCFYYAFDGSKSEYVLLHAVALEDHALSSSNDLELSKKRLKRHLGI